MPRPFAEPERDFRDLDLMVTRERAKCGAAFGVAFRRGGL